MARGVSAIIIGAGPSGIALAHKLKQKLGFEDFTVCLGLGLSRHQHLTIWCSQVYEKLDGPGGTWRVNIYPGW